MTAVLLLAKATVLLALVAAALRLTGERLSAASRHLIWTCAVAALLLLPVATVALPAWRVLPAVPIAAPAGTTRPVTAGQYVQDPENAAAAQIDVPSVQSHNGTRASMRASEAATSRTGTLHWPLALLIVYAAGVFLLIVRAGLQWAAIARVAGRATDIDDHEWRRLLDRCADRAGLRRPVRLLRSAAETMPMAIGVFRPAIVVPALADTWTDDRREAVLLHETAHIARFDCLTQTLATLACALYWVHPGVWWVGRRLRAERELACDDAVLASGAPAREYAGHLLEIAYELRSDIAPAFAVTMASRRQLEGRMLAVLDATRNRTFPGRGWRLAVLMLMATVAIAMASATTSGASIALDEQAAAPAPLAPPAVPAPPAPQAAPARAAQAAAPVAPAPPAAPEPRAPRASTEPGTWNIRADQGTVYLRMSERDGFHGSTVDLSQLSGLAPSLLSGAGGTAGFSLRRDAGTFTFEGIIRDGVGAGTYTFMPNAAFAAEVARRGFDRPTNADLRTFAYADIDRAFFDELSVQRYPRPTLADVLRAGQHGVSASYLREMGSLGYHVGGLQQLVELHDHGVTARYARGLESEGLPRLPVDDLRRAHDHGLTPDYIKDLRDLGYRSTDLETLIALHDHGVSPAYIRELRDLGYTLTLDQITDARNHGIGAEYIRSLAALGYKGLSMNAIVALRNHGIDAQYVRELRAVGYSLTTEQLTNARNHGIDASYIRGFQSLGYTGLSLDDLITLRNHGVDRDEVTRANRQAGMRLPVDRLTELANRGWRQ